MLRLEHLFDLGTSCAPLGVHVGSPSAVAHRKHVSLLAFAYLDSS
jgi:hypothetical protein